MRLAPKLTKETGRLDFTKPAPELVNWVRGLAPVPTAFTTLPDGRLLKIFRAEALPPPADAPVDVPAEAPGTVLTDGRNLLAFRTADGGALRVLDVQLEGKKRMPVTELLRGLRL